MNAIDFCFWLQGFFEISNAGDHLSVEQVQKVKDHLNLVFKHEIDPLRESQTPTSPDALDEAHNGPGNGTGNDPVMRC